MALRSVVLLSNGAWPILYVFVVVELGGGHTQLRLDICSVSSFGGYVYLLVELGGGKEDGVGATKNEC